MERVPVSEEQIFEFARQLDSSTLRSQYLEQACGGDAVLKERVAGLLELHKQHESYLENPPSELAATVDSRVITEKVGDVIGPYKLLQRIGEGGFGVVYMAEQSKPVRRKVAFKVIKPGMDTREVIARFEAERQALALMEHPNIAKVLDGGETESGRPYFAMELVKGVPLTQYCDEQKLSNKERLKLFVTVCSAIQHAHHKGVIHRDIKPSNVMVTLHDGQPVPKVIDFGVSKAINQQLTEKTLFTSYGQMVGTPQYMSPEQAEMSGLDVDTRSDIYSLGVLLYELLTGATPLDAKRLHQAGFAEMQRIIKEEEPPKPSTRVSGTQEQLTTAARHRSSGPDALRKSLRGDLDWIVMKALDKDRNRRYETANGLGRDIERHLSSEPVTAGRPSTLYRLRKFVIRNRGLVISSLTIGAILLLCLGLSLAAYARERSANLLLDEERQKAQENAEAAEKARDLALDQERKAKLFSDVVTDILAGTSTNTKRGKITTVKDMLDQAMEGINITLPDPTEQRADVLSAMGRSYGSIDDAENAIELFEEVSSIYLQHGLTKKYISSQLSLATQKKDPAIAWAALDLAKEQNDGISIGEAYQVIWHTDKSLSFDRKMELAKLGAQTLESTEGGNQIGAYAALTHFVGEWYCYRRQPSTGLLWEAKALNYFELHSPSSPAMLYTLRNMCRASRFLGKKEEAERYGTQLAAKWSVLRDSNALAKNTNQWALNHLIAGLQLNGKFSEMRSQLEEQLKQTDSPLGFKFGVLSRLAWLHQSQGDFVAASKYFRVLKDQFPAEDNFIGVGANLFAAELENGEIPSNDYLDLPDFETHYSTYYHPNARGFTREHYLARSILGDESASRAELRMVESVLKQKISSYSNDSMIWTPDEVQTLNAMLCWCYTRLGEQIRAIEILERLPCKPELDANSAVSLRYREAETAVVELLLKNGDFEAAKNILQMGLEKRRKDFMPANNAQFAFCQQDLARVLLQQYQQGGDKAKSEEAISWASRAFESLFNHPIAPPARAKEAAQLIVEIYEASEKPDQADQWRQKVRELATKNASA